MLTPKGNTSYFAHSIKLKLRDGTSLTSLSAFTYTPDPILSRIYPLQTITRYEGLLYAQYFQLLRNVFNFSWANARMNNIWEMRATFYSRCIFLNQIWYNIQCGYL